MHVVEATQSEREFVTRLPLPPPAHPLPGLLRHLVSAPSLVLIAVDTLAIAVCVWLVATWAAGALPVRIWPVVAAYCAGDVLAIASMGLYTRRQRARVAGVLLRIAVALVAGGVTASLLLSLAAPLLQGVVFDARDALLASFAAFVALSSLRLGYGQLIEDERLKRRVLVYGAGRRAQLVSELRRRSDLRGLAIVGFVDAGDRTVEVPEPRRVTVDEHLLAFARRHRVDEIVVAVDDRRRGLPVRELLDCRMAGVAVADVADFLERETCRVRLDVLTPGWMVFGSGFASNPLRECGSRLLDVAVSASALLLAWPALLLIALAIKLEGGWRAPVFYAQTRVGLQGRPFRVRKFRSMRVDAEAPGQAVWARAQDPRITRIGGFLRRSRLDELPQLLNVLAGEMSLVGPRPERPEFVAELVTRIPYYGERHSVKPGITGWAQLCYPYGASDHDAAEKLQYDLYYVKHRTLTFDIAILLQTAEVVLWGKGSR